MGNNKSERHRTKRIMKQQWLVKLEDIQLQALHLMEEYADGSDSSIKIAAQLQAFSEVLEISKEMASIILSGV